MRQRLCAALVLAFSLLACARPESPAVHCFESRLPDESVLRFQYTEHGGGITGVLDYDFAEKDGAHGTLTGQRDGEVITALWTRTIEGVTETQEVRIRIERDRAVKANGELVGGTDKVLRLRDPEHAIFNETFDRVRCQNRE
jgi:hypothetical protein